MGRHYTDARAAGICESRLGCSGVNKLLMYQAQCTEEAVLNTKPKQQHPPVCATLPVAGASSLLFSPLCNAIVSSFDLRATEKGYHTTP
jgi:hypothetical protein